MLATIPSSHERRMEAKTWKPDHSYHGIQQIVRSKHRKHYIYNNTYTVYVYIYICIIMNVLLYIYYIIVYIYHIMHVLHYTSIIHTYTYIHIYICIYSIYMYIYILLTTGLFSIGPTPFLPSSATLAAKGHGHCVGNRWRKSIQEQHQQGTWPKRRHQTWQLKKPTIYTI